MISINTNLSSLIAQSSMKKATFSLNQAVERMTTGFKINHAKDNAANYSITQNMTTKINSYMVAQDNVAMGLDMLTTAEENLNLISDKLTRLRDLATQASNGTYGESSLNTINAEANALVDEIERLYSTTEYNGISLYDEAKGAGCDMESLPKANAIGFIKEIQRRDTTNMTKFESIAIDQALTSGTYSISTPEELAKLATMTNNGLIGKNTEFVLANDINLSGYANWTPIGNSNSYYFEGNFDGNGFKVSNLYHDTYIHYYTHIGLFGSIKNAEIKNLAVDGEINRSMGTAGMLIGLAVDSIIDNCYSTGSMFAHKGLGGLVGTVNKNSTLSNSYSDVDITVKNTSGALGNYGGLAAINHGGIINCYATGNITGIDSAFNLGGLVGCSSGLISNCYAIGNITGYSNIGGLAGWLPGDEENKIGLLENCYASGNINLLGAGSGNTYGIAGGLFAIGKETMVKNCSAIGKITTTMPDSYLLFALGGGLNNTYEKRDGSEVLNCLYNSSINPNIDIASFNVSVKNCFDVAKMKNDVDIDLQVGTSSSKNSKINMKSSFKLPGLFAIRSLGKFDDNYLSKLDTMLSTVSSKQTEYGAVQNRLESALDEIETQFNNLVSSRSTLRDADIAEESSAYIRQQILQEASATLLATANQSPSIALQLI